MNTPTYELLLKLANEYNYEVGEVLPKEFQAPTVNETLFKMIKFLAGRVVDLEWQIASWTNEG